MRPQIDVSSLKTRSGRPLYLAVKDALRAAIESGVYQPGEQLPSTKQLAAELQVSLVTTHRALQQLVGSGVLLRTQGKGTFVHDQYRERLGAGRDMRMGLVVSPSVSLEHCRAAQIMEGIRREAYALGTDLLLLRYNEDFRNECDGCLILGRPPEEERDAVVRQQRKPTIYVDPGMPTDGIAVEIDHADAARAAIQHLRGLGHRAIGYVGIDESVAPDRWQAFLAACQEVGIAPSRHHVLRCVAWQADERERTALVNMLSSADRPTAILTAGHELALEIYAAARAAALRIPDELSVIAEDDPPAAAYLFPALTAIREPLVDLGRRSVGLLLDLIGGREPPPGSVRLSGQLIVRESTAAASPA